MEWYGRKADRKDTLPLPTVMCVIRETIDAQGANTRHEFVMTYTRTESSFEF